MTESIFSNAEWERAKAENRRQAHVLARLVGPLVEFEVDDYLRFMLSDNLALREKPMKRNTTLQVLSCLVRSADKQPDPKMRDYLDGLALRMFRQLSETIRPSTKTECLAFLRDHPQISCWFLEEALEKIKGAIPDEFPQEHRRKLLHAHHTQVRLGERSTLESNLSEQITVAQTALRQAKINRGNTRVSEALSKMKPLPPGRWTAYQVKRIVKDFRKRRKDYVEVSARNSVSTFRFVRQRIP
jgi:hypothetical protein